MAGMEGAGGLVRPVIRLLRRKTVLALIFCLSFAYCITSLYYGHRYASLSMGSSRFPVEYGEGDGGGGGGGGGEEGTMAFRRTGVAGMMQLDQHDRRPQFFNDLAADEAGVGGGKEHGDGGRDGTGNSLTGDSGSQKGGGTRRKDWCRNSVQGKVLLADDRGFTCHRKDVRSNGCCDESSATARRYSCDTCSPETHCCAIFELCTSCCLDPGKKDFLSRVIGASSSASSSSGGQEKAAGFPSAVLYASLTDHFDFCLARCRTSSHSVQHENSYRDPKAKHCYGPTQPPIPATITASTGP